MHRFLFKWHSRHFYNFQRVFLPSEKAYMEEYFSGVAADDASPAGRYSYCTYSHRVKGKRVNSSRAGFGSLVAPERLQGPALKVLEERGVSVDAELVEAEYSAFYGLAWDCRKEHFKIYFRVQHEHLQTECFRSLLQQVETRGDGLVSYTWQKGQLAETKVYVYPEPDPSLPGGTLRQAHMVTSERGVVPQFDVGAPEDWLERINPIGKRIVKMYEDLGFQLDTIAYEDPENYTLYFPNSP